MSHHDVLVNGGKNLSEKFYLTKIHLEPFITCPAHASSILFWYFLKYMAINEDVTPWRFSENGRKFIDKELFH